MKSRGELDGWKPAPKGRQVASMPCERQGSGESRRFNADQINQQGIFPVDRDDEVALGPAIRHDTWPDSGIGPTKIARIQGREEFLQDFNEQARRRLARGVVRFVRDGHFVRPNIQPPVRAWTEMNSLAGRLRW